MASPSIRSFDCLLDRVRHARQVDKRPVVLVEGDSDRRLWERLIGEVWAIYIAGSREVVLTSLSRCEDLKPIAGIVDRDFDDAVVMAEDNGLPVFSLADADIESALINSDAFDFVVEEFSSAPKLARFGGVGKVREVCVRFAGNVGKIRRANVLRSGSIEFDSIDWSRKIDRDSLDCSDENIASTVQRARGCDLCRDDIIDALGRPLSSYRGKDALVVLGVAFRKAISTHSKATVTPEVIGKGLRLQAGHCGSIIALRNEVDAFLSAN